MAFGIVLTPHLSLDLNSSNRWETDKQLIFTIFRIYPEKYSLASIPEVLVNVEEQHNFTSCFKAQQFMDRIFQQMGMSTISAWKC